MLKPLLICTLVTSLSHVTAVIASLKNCFTPHRNIEIKCMNPIENRRGIPETECSELCGELAPRCQSMQYDAYRSECSLFEEPSPLDAAIAASEINLRRVRLSRSILRTGENMPEPKKDDCLPMVVPSIGVSHYTVNVTCLREFGVPLTPPLRSKSRDEQKILNNQRDSIIPQQNSGQSEVFGTTIPKKNTSAADVVPVIPDCANNEIAHIQIISGVQVDADPTISFHAETVEQCVVVCRHNKYLNGRRLPLLCRSAHYDWPSKMCSLFPDALNPNGFLNYVPNNQVLYMEKICISPNLLDASCEEVFQRIPQHVLIGHATDITTATSEQDCILQCLTAHLNRGFTCRSIIHYSDFPVANCILNFHTKQSRMPYFAIEVELKVDYVELPPCTFRVPRRLQEGRAAITFRNDIKYQPAAKTTNIQVVPSDKSGSFQVDGDVRDINIEKVAGYALPTAFNPNDVIQSYVDQKTPTEIPVLPLETAQSRNIPENSNDNSVSTRSTWSEWSECDPKTAIKKRSKICAEESECKPHLEIQPCFTQSEFDRALAVFLKEQKEKKQTIRSTQVENTSEDAGVRIVEKML